MKITHLIAHHVRIPLKKPIRHASYQRTESENLVIECRLEDGTSGYGEGVPREYVTGETIEGDIALLQQSKLNEFCQANRWASFEEVVRGMEGFQTADVEGDERKCRGNAARCAVELAVFDAYGQHYGRPMSEIPKVLIPALYGSKDRVQYSTAITSARGWKVRASAFAMRLYGFRQMKVKVGIEGHDDVDRLRAIRRRVRDKMDIRIDANEAWTQGNVIEKIRELEPFGISSVEQPMRHEDVMFLANVRKEVRTPIMHDESLCSMVDAEHAVEHGTCDLFNIRLSKCGGFIPSLRLADYAAAHGLGYQLGCQVGETALLSAAGRHFACSVKDIRYLEGSYDSRLVKESLATQDITFGYGGKAPSLLGGGLGVSVDRAALERVTVNRVEL